MNGYARPRTSPLVPAFRFAGRLLFWAGLLLGLLLGTIALAGVALAAI